MRDPLERMLMFVEEQKQQAQLAHARDVWSRTLPCLLPCLRSVVEAFSSGLAEPSPQTLVSVLADPGRIEFPLVIAFARRAHDQEGILPLRAAASESEAGASCHFRCDLDGIVYGYRYPFHSVLRDVRPERFVDLGEPDRVQAEQVGNAVVDFLIWASVGDGRGSRKLRFWSPVEQSSVVAAQTRTLRVIAA